MKKTKGPRISPSLLPPKWWERCLVTVKNFVPAHQILFEQILTSCMWTWAWWKSWWKGSKSVVHTAAVVHTWFVGDETQTQKMHFFRRSCSRQYIFCYPEKKICCKSSGWSRRQWRRPWRGSSISSSKTNLPLTSGGCRSPLKSAFWSAMSMRKNQSKYIFIYRQQFSFYLLSDIWFRTHLVQYQNKKFTWKNAKTSWHYHSRI